MLKESDIMHENGQYWVARMVSQNERIAPKGSVYYQVFRSGITHSTGENYVTANLQRAIAYCDRKAAAQV